MWDVFLQSCFSFMLYIINFRKGLVTGSWCCLYTVGILLIWYRPIVCHKCSVAQISWKRLLSYRNLVWGIFKMCTSSLSVFVKDYRLPWHGSANVYPVSALWLCCMELGLLLLLQISFIFSSSSLVRHGAVSWGTALQAGRSRVWFPVVSLEIFYWWNPSGRTMAQQLAQPLTDMSTRNISWGVKAASA